MSPLYEYGCPECSNKLVELRSMNERNDLPKCDHCGVYMKRKIE